MLELFLLTTGTSSLLIAYILYGLATRRGLVAPNRASWLIWSATTTTEALTYNAINQGAVQNLVFFVSSIACIAVTISVWRHSNWARPTRLETACMAICLVSLVLWIGFQNAVWAHILLLVIIPISILPTWASMRKDPGYETSPAWGLWTVSDIATLGFILIHSKSYGLDLPYVIIELVCHTITWAMIGFASINPFSAFRVIGKSIMMPTKDGESGRQFLIGRNYLGKAVYAGEAFEKGQELIRMKGPVFTRADLPDVIHDASDRFLQIGTDTFIGPSDGIDDLFNHSCDPNSGIVFASTGPVLIALRDVAFAEELRFDYSTTILDPNWSMKCACGAQNCRRLLRDFQSLSEPTKLAYRQLNIVPDYVWDSLSA